MEHILTALTEDLQGEDLAVVVDGDLPVYGSRKALKGFGGVGYPKEKIAAVFCDALKEVGDLGWERCRGPIVLHFSDEIVQQAMGGGAVAFCAHLPTPALVGRGVLSRVFVVLSPKAIRKQTRGMSNAYVSAYIRYLIAHELAHALGVYGLRKHVGKRFLDPIELLADAVALWVIFSEAGKLSNFEFRRLFGYLTPAWRCLLETWPNRTDLTKIAECISWRARVWADDRSGFQESLILELLSMPLGGKEHRSTVAAIEPSQLQTAASNQPRSLAR